MLAVEESVIFNNEFMTIHVSPTVYSCWLQHRQMNNSDTEQFGVLIGSRLPNDKTFWIDLCTTPKRQDKSKRASFLMQDPFHQKEIDKAFKKSSGEMGYLGTWHTHPQTHPVPSSIDIKDWLNCMVRNPDRLLLFVIVGQEQTNIYINLNNNLEIISRDNNG
jgi:integrative and conjugative element protein (TIGR02256 family)